MEFPHGSQQSHYPDNFAPCSVKNSRQRARLLFAQLRWAAGILALAPSGQLRAQLPQNPEQQKEKEDDSHRPKFDPKLILAANQKEIKKNVEKLYDLASELKAEVEKTDSVLVLSVAMLRKTDEIERLAKEIRSRAKG